MITPEGAYPVADSRKIMLRTFVVGPTRVPTLLVFLYVVGMNGLFYTMLGIDTFEVAISKTLSLH
jgi:hypothetical protein